MVCIMDSYRILIGICSQGRFFRYETAVEKAGFHPVFVTEAYDVLNRRLQGRLLRCVYADRRFCDACAEQYDGLLLPGMFARVKLTGETVPNAILVPQRAVQQLLDKTFVMVVGADGKSEVRKIELGQQVGSYYIVKSGLSAEDTVIVEGLSSLTEGKDLTVTMVTPADMGFSLDEDTTPYDTMTSSDASSGSES